MKDKTPLQELVCSRPFLIFAFGYCYLLLFGTVVKVYIELAYKIVNVWDYVTIFLCLWCIRGARIQWKKTRKP